MSRRSHNVNNATKNREKSSLVSWLTNANATGKKWPDMSEMPKMMTGNARLVILYVPSMWVTLLLPCCCSRLMSRLQDMKMKRWFSSVPVATTELNSKAVVSSMLSKNLSGARYSDTGPSSNWTSVVLRLNSLLKLRICSLEGQQMVASYSDRRAMSVNSICLLVVMPEAMISRILAL